jgi:hypothetical protein
MPGQIYENELSFSSIAGDDSTYSGFLNAQSFVPGITHSVAFVGMYLSKRAGDRTPGNLSIEIQSDNSDKPDGVAIASCVVLSVTLPIIPDRSFVITALDRNPILQSGTKYWIVTSSPGVGVFNNIYSGITNSNLYDAGKRIFSSNGGTSWSGVSAIDSLFAEYGPENTMQFSPTGTNYLINHY